jgi:hypothetical protein
VGFAHMIAGFTDFVKAVVSSLAYAAGYAMRLVVVMTMYTVVVASGFLVLRHGPAAAENATLEPVLYAIGALLILLLCLALLRFKLEPEFVNYVSKHKDQDIQFLN